DPHAGGRIEPKQAPVVAHPAVRAKPGSAATLLIDRSNRRGSYMRRSPPALVRRRRGNRACATRRAARRRRVGCPAVRAATIREQQIVIEEHPDPVPGLAGVLVRVRAAGLNGGDMMQLRGLSPAPPGSPADIP